MTQRPEDTSGFVKCTVISCPNFLQAGVPQNQKNRFFPFPSDRSLAKIWKQKCGVADHYCIKAAQVCSQHFATSDIVNNALRARAVPQENLNWMMGMPEVTLTFAVVNDDEQKIKEENLKLENELKKKIEVLKALTEKNDLYKTKVFHVRNEIDRLRKLTGKCAVVGMNGKICDNLLGKVFSHAQIKMLMGKKKVVWSNDDMAMAFTLRHVGNKQLYLYLKNKLNMPLPTLDIVQKWANASKVKVEKK